MRTKGKKSKNNFIPLLAVLIFICILIIVIKNGAKSKNLVENVGTVQNVIENNKSKENVINTQEENNVVEEPTKSKKIDFLANVTEPKYYKSEKNIKIPVIIYHAFGEVSKSDNNYGLYSTEERFEDNVKTLLDAGYTFVNLEEIYEYNKGNLALPEKVCVITMDDGWKGCYTEAFNVLKKYNVPATIFIINYYMGGEEYLTWDQAKEMFDSGLVKIHIHGLWHNDCTTLSKEDLVAQYNTAHDEIEEKMGEKIQRIMAYPAGSHNENTIK